MRATLSITNNIAEGFEREWNKEFRQFLIYAKWSVWEVRSMLHLAYELWYIPEEKIDKFQAQCVDLSARINNLIRKVEQ